MASCSCESIFKGVCDLRKERWCIVPWFWLTFSPTFRHCIAESDEVSPSPPRHISSWPFFFCSYLKTESPTFLKKKQEINQKQPNIINTCSVTANFANLANRLLLRLLRVPRCPHKLQPILTFLINRPVGCIFNKETKFSPTTHPTPTVPMHACQSPHGRGRPHARPPCVQPRPPPVIIHKVNNVFGF